MNAQWTQEKEEKSVVSPAYTVIHPWAVMVKCLKNKPFYWIKYQTWGTAQ